MGGGELVHEGEAEVVFFGSEVDGGEATGKALGSFPTDLTAKAGGIATSFEGADVGKEFEENGLKEMPVFGAAAKEAAEPEFIALALINVNDSEVALAAGGDIEPKAKGGGTLRSAARGVAVWGSERQTLKEWEECLVDEVGDFVFSAVFTARIEGAEEVDNLGVFKMEADDAVVVAAAFDGGPVNDVIGGSAQRVAHIALLIDFFLTRPGTAASEKFFGFELSAARAVNDIEEPEFDGVGHGDAIVQIPRGGGGDGVLA